MSDVAPEPVEPRVPDDENTVTDLDPERHVDRPDDAEEAMDRWREAWLEGSPE